jgi:ATP-dependent DNA helicase RecQ
MLLASRMDLGRLIRFIKERETSVADVRAYVGRLRGMAGGDEVLAIGHGELGERDRVLLSIAERAGAVELSPGGPEGLRVRLTGQGSPRAAAESIRAARERSWNSYRSIERYSSEGERCRRRQILDHFGDEEPTAPTGRCCDVCDPDPALAAAMAAAPTSGKRSSGGRRRGTGGSAAEASDFDVPADQFEALRSWRMGRSEGKPAYTVASDATLRELLHRRPGTLGQLVEVRGIGPSFCEKHGASLLVELARLSS